MRNHPSTNNAILCVVAMAELIVNFPFASHDSPFIWDLAITATHNAHSAGIVFDCCKPLPMGLLVVLSGELRVSKALSAGQCRARCTGCCF
jgi:hypothetical protein